MPGPIRPNDPSSHYDYQAQTCGETEAPVCGGGPDASTGKRASTAPAPAPQRSAGTQKLVQQATRSKAKAREAKLCRERKRTNTYLCGVLGSVVSGRLGAKTPLARLAGANVSQIVSGECRQTFDWLEKHAPGGACGKD